MLLCAIIKILEPLEHKFKIIIFFVLKRRAFHFNIAQIQVHYQFHTKCLFLKESSSPSDVRCEKCHTEFSVIRGCASEIEQHLRSVKHKNVDIGAWKCSSMLMKCPLETGLLYRKLGKSPVNRNHIEII